MACTCMHYIHCSSLFITFYNTCIPHGVKVEGVHESIRPESLHPFEFEFSRATKSTDCECSAIQCDCDLKADDPGRSKKDSRLKSFGLCCLCSDLVFEKMLACLAAKVGTKTLHKAVLMLWLDWNGSRTDFYLSRDFWTIDGKRKYSNYCHWLLQSIVISTQMAHGMHMYALHSLFITIYNTCIPHGLKVEGVHESIRPESLHPLNLWYFLDPEVIDTASSSKQYVSMSFAERVISVCLNHLSTVSGTPSSTTFGRLSRSCDAPLTRTVPKPRFVIILALH